MMLFSLRKSCETVPIALQLEVWSLENKCNTDMPISNTAMVLFLAFIGYGFAHKSLAPLVPRDCRVRKMEVKRISYDRILRVPPPAAATATPVSTVSIRATGVCCGP